MKIASVDFETYYDAKVSLKKMGVWEYLHHLDCEIHTVSIWTEEGYFVGRPEDAPWDQIDGHIWVAHNAAFDSEVFKKVCEDHPEIVARPAYWQCTANFSAYMGCARNLADTVRFLFDADVSKDVRTQMKGKTYAAMVASGLMREVLEYALRDAEWCYRIATEWFHLWPAIEQRLSRFTMLNTARGLPTDRDKLDESIKILDRVMWEAQDDLPWRADGEDERAVLSPIALAAACRKVGVTPPKSLAEDSEECQQWELENLDIPWVASMRRYRKGNLLRSKLATMRSRMRTDGRIHYGMKYFGGHTGRWSGDQGFNVHGFMRDPFTGVLRDGTPYSIDMRAHVVAGNGKKLVMPDLSQIEPRGLHYMVGDWKFLDMVRSGISVYEVHARNTMGWTGGDLKKEDKLIYAKAKARELGLGYGCGWAKFVAYAKTYGVVLTALESKKTVNQYREKEKLIVAFWDEMHKLLEQACRRGEDLEIELPSWRSLRYTDVRKAKLKTGKIATVAEIAGGRMQVLWGSKIVENIIQAICRDIFGEAMLRVEDAGFPIFMHVHDEMVAEVDEDADENEIVELIKIPPTWFPDIPVDSEAPVGKCYLK